MNIKTKNNINKAISMLNIINVNSWTKEERNGITLAAFTLANAYLKIAEEEFKLKNKIEKSKIKSEPYNYGIESLHD